jgi:hypothetical protein
LVYFHHYYLMLPLGHLGTVVTQTTHILEPDWVSSAEISSSTSCVNQNKVVNTLSFQLVISNAAEYS